MPIGFPRLKELSTFVLALGVWLLITGLFIGFRPEHVFMSILMVGLFCAKPSRQLLMALMPFVLFAISYDWMNLLPNYMVNPVDIQGLYEAEKSIFGIRTANGILTPNEFFAVHYCAVADIFAGICYLCWVPVPVAFGISLFFIRQRRTCISFGIVFLLVNLIGFCGYYIHPAAPPWYVMSHGFDFLLGTPGEVAGLGRFDQLTGLNIFQSIYSRNANVFAAVPSLHSAYMVVTLFYSLKIRYPNLLRGLFTILMFGIWFTAIYSGHHYCIDVILGALCAIMGILLFECILLRIEGVQRFLNAYTRYIC